MFLNGFMLAAGAMVAFALAVVLSEASTRHVGQNTVVINMSTGSKMTLPFRCKLHDSGLALDCYGQGYHFFADGYLIGNQKQVP
jgi:hypothetical protein